jgi:hypothetical protein
MLSSDRTRPNAQSVPRMSPGTSTTAAVRLRYRFPILAVLVAEPTSAVTVAWLLSGSRIEAVPSASVVAASSPSRRTCASATGSPSAVTVTDANDPGNGNCASSATDSSGTSMVCSLVTAPRSTATRVSPGSSRDSTVALPVASVVATCSPSWYTAASGTGVSPTVAVIVNSLSGTTVSDRICASVRTSTVRLIPAAGSLDMPAVVTVTRSR